VIERHTTEAAAKLTGSPLSAKVAMLNSSVSPVRAPPGSLAPGSPVHARVPQGGFDPLALVEAETTMMHQKSSEVFSVNMRNAEIRAAHDAETLQKQREKFEARNREMEAQLKQDEARLNDLAEATNIAKRIEEQESAFQNQVAMDGQTRVEEAARVEEAKHAANMERAVQEDRMAAVNQAAAADEANIERLHMQGIQEHEAKMRSIHEERDKREAELQVHLDHVQGDVARHQEQAFHQNQAHREAQRQGESEKLAERGAQLMAEAHEGARLDALNGPLPPGALGAILPPIAAFPVPAPLPPAPLPPHSGFIPLPHQPPVVPPLPLRKAGLIPDDKLEDPGLINSPRGIPPLVPMPMPMPGPVLHPPGMRMDMVHAIDQSTAAASVHRLVAMVHSRSRLETQDKAPDTAPVESTPQDDKENTVENTAAES